jgi:hypothetical protein
LGHVKVFDGLTNSEIRSFLAYGAGYSGGIFVGGGDVNHDGHDDIITGVDSGFAPHVKVFDGLTNAEIRSFFAYGAGFTGGVRVAAGDVNGDGFADIITGTGPGAGQLKVIDGKTGGELLNFFPYVGWTGGIFVGSSLAPVPEPTMLPLLALTVTTLVRRRSRRKGAPASTLH